MSLKKSLEEKKFDVRLVDFNKRVGLLNNDDIQAHNSQLKDVEANSEPISLADEEDYLNTMDIKTDSNTFM